MLIQSEAIKRGDLEVFGSFYRNHYGRLIAYCQLFVKDKMLAEDLVQETFIHFWEKRASIDSERNMESLLFISLRNRCFNYLRDQNTASIKLSEYVENTQTLQYISQIDYLNDEGVSLEDKLMQELDAAIELLPIRCRDVFRLAKLEGFKNREVAEKLGVSVKTVERQLNIAKQKIEGHMKSNYSFILLFLLF